MRVVFYLRRQLLICIFSTSKVVKPDFFMVLDVLTEHNQDLVIMHCLVFADDLVLMGESKDEKNGLT